MSRLPKPQADDKCARCGKRRDEHYDHKCASGAEFLRLGAIVVCPRCGAWFGESDVKRLDWTCDDCGVPL